jgi:dsDNA-specific endonuclease/ATPase MutS2
MRRTFFNKLMMIQADSITEAAINEIIYRAQHFTREGVPNISKEDRDELPTKMVEKFNTIIDFMKKYKILDGLGAATIYDKLHKLRKYRNKAHIQTDVDIKVTRRAHRVLQDIRRRVAGLIVRVLNSLNATYSRPKDLGQYALELSIPSS